MPQPEGLGSWAACRCQVRLCGWGSRAMSLPGLQLEETLQAASPLEAWAGPGRFAAEPRKDSWPPEKNSIWGQRRGWIAQSFCVIKFY